VQKRAEVEEVKRRANLKRYPSKGIRANEKSYGKKGGGVKKKKNKKKRGRGTERLGGRFRHNILRRSMDGNIEGRLGYPGGRGG